MADLSDESVLYAQMYFGFLNNFEDLDQNQRRLLLTLEKFLQVRLEFLTEQMSGAVNEYRKKLSSELKDVEDKLNGKNLPDG